MTSPTAATSKRSATSKRRHDLGRKVFHGNKGEFYQRYHTGMEDQLSALGLVLNCIVLWNTVYMNAALDELAIGVPFAARLLHVIRYIDHQTG